MILPDDSLGITDLMTYRECPRKFSYGLQRHIGVGLQSEASLPENQEKGAVYARAYGSAIHEVLHLVEEGHSDEDAIQEAWGIYGTDLEPGDLQMMRDDLAVYRARDFPNTRIVASEDDFRLPLFVYQGRQVYFRFKVDRLYERLDAPGTFIAVDYKSSKWPKGEVEVREDLQLWAYNWAIHEFFPEVETLLQVYDQLRYGQVPTRKTAAKREEIRQFLIASITAVLDDERVKEDGLLPHKKNQWCPWCPIMESCPVVQELLEFGMVEIDALAPARKEGRKSVVDVDPARLEEYLERFDDAKLAIKVLERFVKAVGDILKKMPAEDRVGHGYDLRTRSASTFSSSALRELHAKLGPEFYELVKVTKTGLESYFGDDKETLDWALGLALEQDGAQVLVDLALKK